MSTQDILLQLDVKIRELGTRQQEEATAAENQRRTDKRKLDRLEARCLDMKEETKKSKQEKDELKARLEIITSKHTLLKKDFYAIVQERHERPPPTEEDRHGVDSAGLRSRIPASPDALVRQGLQRGVITQTQRHGSSDRQFPVHGVARVGPPPLRYECIEYKLHLKIRTAIREACTEWYNGRGSEDAQPRDARPAPGQLCIWSRMLLLDGCAFTYAGEDDTFACDAYLEGRKPCLWVPEPDNQFGTRIQFRPLPVSVRCRGITKTARF